MSSVGLSLGGTSKRVEPIKAAVPILMPKKQHEDLFSSMGMSVDYKKPSKVNTAPSTASANSKFLNLEIPSHDDSNDNWGEEDDLDLDI